MFLKFFKNYRLADIFLNQIPGINQCAIEEQFDKLSNNLMRKIFNL